MIVSKRPFISWSTWTPRGDLLEHSISLEDLLPGAIELGLHSQRVDVGELSTRTAVWWLKKRNGPFE